MRAAAARTSCGVVHTRLRARRAPASFPSKTLVARVATVTACVASQAPASGRVATRHSPSQARILTRGIDRGAGHVRELENEDPCSDSLCPACAAVSDRLLIQVDVWNRSEIAIANSESSSRGAPALRRPRGRYDRPLARPHGRAARRAAAQVVVRWQCIIGPDGTWSVGTPVRGRNPTLNVAP